MAGKKGVPSSKRGKGAGYRWIVEHAGHRSDECLPWPFSVDSRVGRGRLGHEGKNYWAHRLMCEVAHGPAPSSLHQAAHECGKGHEGCVNPLHLSWKTNLENSQDKILHGTTRKAGGKKLPSDIVAKIKAAKGQQTQVSTAATFGVSLSCVQYHQHGRERWPSHNGRKA